MKVMVTVKSCIQTRVLLEVIVSAVVLANAVSGGAQQGQQSRSAKHQDASTQHSIPDAFLHPKYGKPFVRPRVIVTTDGEIDDRCSMIRFLMYSNEFDVEGLIYSSSMFHWLGQTWSGVEWINAEIEMYSRVYPSLIRNAEGYPTPDELRSKVYVGNIDYVGEMTKDSPGADRIMEVLLDDKPGTVYLQAWGGVNTIARALYRIQHEHPEAVERVSQKAVIYDILDQDDTLRKYVEPNWPRLQVLLSNGQFAAIAYWWRSLMPASESVFFERPWMEGNISTDHGSLTGAYESANGAFRSEGDSPSFIYEIEVGLRSLESPDHGGWGGRFVPEKPGVNNIWKDGSDDGDLFKPIWRWAQAFQNDWAARADWCVKSYKEANHPPVINVEGPLDIVVRPDDIVPVSVAGSTDPDGNRLSYRWWQYKDAGSILDKVEITGADGETAFVHVPANARENDTIHIVAEVTDDGRPPLTRYARFILKVLEAPHNMVEGK